MRGVEHVFVSDWAIQIPLWVAVPFLLLFCWAGWKFVAWVIAALR
jgi:hypothetical protein